MQYVRLLNEQPKKKIAICGAILVMLHHASCIIQNTYESHKLSKHSAGARKSLLGEPRFILEGLYYRSLVQKNDGVVPWVGARVRFQNHSYHCNGPITRSHLSFHKPRAKHECSDNTNDDFTVHSCNAEDVLLWTLHPVLIKIPKELIGVDLFKAKSTRIPVPQENDVDQAHRGQANMIAIVILDTFYTIVQ